MGTFVIEIPCCDDTFTFNELHALQIGWSSLHTSAVNGDADVCEFLLQSGADIESLDEVLWS